MRNLALLSLLTPTLALGMDNIHGSSELKLSEPITRHADVSSQLFTQTLSVDYYADTWQFRAQGRLRYDAVYEGDNPFSEEAKEAYHLSSDWRELVLQGEQWGFTWTIGYQQVVWGNADNLRIIDQVNPLDFRDFVLPDLNDYRQAIPLVKSTGYIDDWEVELLYIPFFEANKLAAQGSQFEWDYLPDDLQNSFIIADTQYPSHQFKNGELGARISRLWGETDVTLVAFYTRDDNPVYRLDYVPQNQQYIPRIQAEYQRQWMLGGAFSTPLPQGFIGRMELSYIPNFAYNDLQKDDAISQSATTTGMLGLDYLYKDWLFAAQISDRLIHDWQETYLVPEHQAIYTLSAEGENLEGKLRSRLAFSQMPNNGDGSWWQFKTRYQFSPAWEMDAELNLLNGQSNGFFGQFRDIDLIQSGIKYQF